ncbi:MAG: hypothetical protein FWJ62_06480, partial [Thermaerobacter sp.]
PSTDPVLVLVDDDVEGTVARLKAAGVHIISGPYRASWQPHRIAAEFRDSEGNCMVLASPR